MKPLLRHEQDCLAELFDELRHNIPALPDMISNCDLRTQWLASLAQVIGAMHTPEWQWAALVQVADVLVTTRYPGLPLNMAYAWLAQQCGLGHVLRAVQAQHLEQR